MGKTHTPNLQFELAFWSDGYRVVAGLDEAGRGAWAGPVVAAAVVLPPLDAAQARNWMRSELYRAVSRVDDSKRLTPKAREELFEPIRACALACATGAASHQEIDEIGIVPASKLAMQRALDGLSLSPDALLLDALVLQEVDLVQMGVVHGDGLSVSIAAASILAKVTRDRLMCDLESDFPGYCFSHHKGYGTAEHVAALARLGPSAIHRRSYEPIRLPIEQGITPEPVQPDAL